MELSQRLIYTLMNKGFAWVGRASWRTLDFLSGWIYKSLTRGLRYRRTLVAAHLQQAFPELSEKARQDIEKAFYQLFADWMVEVAFMHARGWEAVAERFEIKNLHLFDEAHDRGQSVILAMGHQFNWEWGGWVLRRVTKAPILCVYLPINAAGPDRFFRELRGRYGTEMLPLGRMGARLARIRHLTHTLILMADQSPSDLARAHWIPFLNRLTAWHGGLERSAQLGDYRVLFVEIVRVARHRYEAYPSLLTDTPAALPPGELTRQYVAALEASLRRNPENWLWTHRRWKHSPPGLLSSPEEAIQNRQKPEIEEGARR
ncbi:MAG: lysophospholipid acyltransferase family protein [Bacteroidia bacterium]|nr:lysophospholipid acyltransferase family protein [Bacteroidia bacterium]MDW8088279.1 lysophospholipid acyltransferase family protein [Bacteroidia bacterium]